MDASPIKSQVVAIEFGLDAADEPVYLPRFDCVVGQSLRYAPVIARLSATYVGARMIGTATFLEKPGPPSHNSARTLSRPLP